jgi:hypothetical protein
MGEKLGLGGFISFKNSFEATDGTWADLCPVSRILYYYITVEISSSFYVQYM